jgi:hypothetical protein
MEASSTGGRWPFDDARESTSTVHFNHIANLERTDLGVRNSVMRSCRRPALIMPAGPIVRARVNAMAKQLDISALRADALPTASAVTDRHPPV